MRSRPRRGRGWSRLLRTSPPLGDWSMTVSHRLGLAAFLAHLAAEKALKGALIARGVVTRKIHDLVELQSSLVSGDAATVSSDDIDILVPWNIAGRYPADLGDPGPRTAATAVEAAGRIVGALSRQVLSPANPSKSSPPSSEPHDAR